MTTGRTGRRLGGWPAVAAYAAVNGVNQMLWLTFTPITTGSARHYGVSTGAIGWLAELFPLLYVVLAVPAGRLLDANLPRWVVVGAVLTAAGAVLRPLDGYATVLAGQLVVAVAQPLLLTAVTAVPSACLPAASRANGIAACSAGVFGGMVAALATGAAFGDAHIAPLLWTQAGVSVIGALAVCVTARGIIGGVAVGEGSLRRVWANRELRLLVGLVCAGFGVFVALTTWLQTLLDPAGVSDTAAGVLLLAMVVAGVLGSAVLPPMLVRRGRELRFVAGSVVGAVAALVLLAAAPAVWSGAVSSVVLGALLLTDLPLILDLVERRNPSAAATGLVWIAGNAAGIVAALVVQVVRHRPTVAFLVLAALMLAALPLLAALTGRRPVPADRVP